MGSYIKIAKISTYIINTLDITLFTMILDLYKQFCTILDVNI